MKRKLPYVLATLVWGFLLLPNIDNKTPGQLRWVGTPFPTAAILWIPKGSFLMGVPPRSWRVTQFPIRLRKGFWIWQTEVTQGQYKALMGKNPAYFKKCGLHCPVERVSWSDAAKFANALSRKQGLPTCFKADGSALKTRYLGDKVYDTCKGWRLPTEAEWEYAARAGAKGSFYHGRPRIQGLCYAPSPCDIAWFVENSAEDGKKAGSCQLRGSKRLYSLNHRPHPVAQKQPNSWGLYDMLGNVFEWTLDKQGYGRVLSPISPLGEYDWKERVIRGGSWWASRGGIRLGASYLQSPDRRFFFTGFRLVRSP